MEGGLLALYRLWELLHQNGNLTLLLTVIRRQAIFKKLYRTEINQILKIAESITEKFIRQQVDNEAVKEETFSKKEEFILCISRFGESF